MASTSDTLAHTVGYLGPLASYCHQAVNQVFRADTITPISCPTIASVFAAVQSESTEFGVVPIENSTNGHVQITQDLFASAISRDSLPFDEARGPFPDVHVCGEIIVEVKHCLLGRSGQQVWQAGSDIETGLSRIKTVYTHPQAWGQCTGILSGDLKHAEQIDTTSTARAAEIVANIGANEIGELGRDAAISSRLAAEAYGLQILKADIQDENINYTRFYIMHKHTPKANKNLQRRQLLLTDLVPSVSAPRATRLKALVIFAVSSFTRPLALSNALAIFGKNNFNLTSINARPSRTAPWNYVFMVEFVHNDGEAEVGSIETLANRARRALGELESVTKTWRWFGSWEVPSAQS